MASQIWPTQTGPSELLHLLMVLEKTLPVPGTPCADPALKVRDASAPPTDLSLPQSTWVSKGGRPSFKGKLGASPACQDYGKPLSVGTAPLDPYTTVAGGGAAGAVAP